MYENIVPNGPNFFQRLVSGSNSPILITDALAADQPIIFVNRAFTATCGFTKDGVLGKNCRFMQGVDRQQHARKVLAEAIAAGRTSETLIRNYRKDGSMFWNQLYMYPLHDDQGRVTHFVGIQHDVTESVQTRMALEAQRTELAQLYARSEERSAQLDQAVRHLKHLSSKLVGVQDYERKELARNLHEDFAQRLAALNVALNVLRPDAVGQEASKAWQDVLMSVGSMLDQIRDIVAELRPATLDFFNLEVAIRRLVSNVFSPTSIVLSIDLPPLPSNLPEAVKITAYRVVEETVGDVVRRASATHAAVTMRLNDTCDALEIQVHDDGTVFGTGFTALAERVELLGGSFQINCAKERGTTVRTTLPLTSP